MRRKSEVEVKKAAISKTMRTLLRLKHTLQFDEELNNTLPDTLEQFDRAVLDGQLPALELKVSDVLKSI